MVEGNHCALIYDLCLVHRSIFCGQTMSTRSQIDREATKTGFRGGWQPSQESAILSLRSQSDPQQSGSNQYLTSLRCESFPNTRHACVFQIILVLLEDHFRTCTYPTSCDPFSLFIHCSAYFAICDSRDDDCHPVEARDLSLLSDSVAMHLKLAYFAEGCPRSAVYRSAAISRSHLHQLLTKSGWRTVSSFALGSFALWPRYRI